jgi:uncharacterized membrane protein
MKTKRSIAIVAIVVISVGLIFAIIGSVYAQTNTTAKSDGNTTKAGNQTNNTAGGGMASKIPVIGPILNKIPGLSGK